MAKLNNPMTKTSQLSPTISARLQEIAEELNQNTVRPVPLLQYSPSEQPVNTGKVLNRNTSEPYRLSIKDLALMLAHYDAEQIAPDTPSRVEFLNNYFNTKQ
jgi:hypothetical protein